MMNVIVERVTEAIARRSQESRRRYLEKIARATDRGKGRANMGCSNLRTAWQPAPLRRNRSCRVKPR